MFKKSSILDRCLLISLLVFLQYGCNVSSSDQLSNAPVEQKQDVKPEDTAKQPGSVDSMFSQYTEGVPQGLKDGWQQFTADGRYRVAREEDFRFPEEAKKVIEGIDHRTKRPYMRILWDINENGDYNEFAAIVVETTKSDDARFGLVILSAPDGGSGLYKPHWVYQERDLSRTIMASASSRLSVESYLDDGTREACFVVWDRRQRRYFCK